MLFAAVTIGPYFQIRPYSHLTMYAQSPHRKGDGACDCYVFPSRPEGADYPFAALHQIVKASKTKQQNRIHPTPTEFTTYPHTTAPESSKPASITRDLGRPEHRAWGSKSCPSSRLREPTIAAPNNEDSVSLCGPSVQLHSPLQLGLFQSWQGFLLGHRVAQGSMAHRETRSALSSKIKLRFSGTGSCLISFWGTWDRKRTLPIGARVKRCLAE